MNPKIKNYLGMALIAGVLLGAYGIVSYANSYSRTIGLSVRSFSIEGSGEVAVVPDVAQFTFGVKTEGGENLADLQSENATKINQTIDFLKSNGVADEDIQTQRLNIYPRYSSYNCYRAFDIQVESLAYPAPECPPQRIIGYTIDQSVQVKVRDMERVGDLFAGVVDNGANTASNLAFTVDDTAEFENEARAEAIEKAQNKAEAIAKSAGFKLGKLLSIDEYSAGSQYGFGFNEARSYEVGDASPKIEPGTQDLTVNVILRYEIR